MMNLLALGCLLAAQETPKETKTARFAYDYFKSWSSFAEGSSVEFEMEAAGTKMTITKTIDKKEADVVHLKTSTQLAQLPNPLEGTEDVKKQEAPAAEGDCPLCKKPFKEHKDEAKWSEQKMTIGETKLTCRVYESPPTTCDGKEMPKVELWYSESVPGHLVLMKTAQVTMTCTKFVDKTVRAGLKK